MVINDTRPFSDQKFYLLAKEEAVTYQLCEIVHNFNSIFTRLREYYPLITEDDLRTVLSNLLNKKLLLGDNDRYLSLAIPVKP
jgi:hypothetical protein